MSSTIMGKVPKKPYTGQAIPRLAFFQGELAENGAGQLLTSLSVDRGDFQKSKPTAVSLKSKPVAVQEKPEPVMVPKESEQILAPRKPKNFIALQKPKPEVAPEKPELVLSTEPPLAKTAEKPEIVARHKKQAAPQAKGTFYK